MTTFLSFFALCPSHALSNDSNTGQSTTDIFINFSVHLTKEGASLGNVSLDNSTFYNKSFHTNLRG
eukprot:6461397-Amphidinium_carterae.2